MDTHNASSNASRTGAALATALRAGGAARDGLVWGVQTFASTRSTGARIASLHGAPLEKATLAWFGFGAKKAGGGGIAAGTVVLAAVVAAPVVGVIAIKAAPAIAKRRAKRAVTEQGEPDGESTE